MQLDSLQIRSSESVSAYVERGNQLFQQGFIYGQMSEKAALGQVLRGLPTVLGDVLPGMDKVVTFHRLSSMVHEVEWLWPETTVCCTTVGDRDPPKLS